jgi:hypothetical protein
METIAIVGAQKSSKSTESDRSEATCGVGVTDAPLEMAEIVRFSNDEKNARGLRAKSISAAKTQPAEPREIIGVKSNAAEQHEGDFSRKAEARAFASYWQRPI